MELLLATLACWSITHMVSNLDGPFGMFARLRSKLWGQLKEMFSCFMCLSVWLAIPFTLWIVHTLPELVIYTLAISAGATLIEWLSEAL